MSNPNNQPWLKGPSLQVPGYRSSPAASNRVGGGGVVRIKLFHHNTTHPRHPDVQPVSKSADTSPQLPSFTLAHSLSGPSLPVATTATALAPVEFLSSNGKNNAISEFPSRNNLISQNESKTSTNMLNNNKQTYYHGSRSPVDTVPTKVPTISGSSSFTSSLHSTDKASKAPSAQPTTITSDMARAFNINTNQDPSGSKLAELLSPMVMRNSSSERMMSGASSTLTLPSVRSLSSMALHQALPILVTPSSSTSFPSTPTEATSINSPTSSDGTNDAWLLHGQTKRTEKLMRQAFIEINDICKQLNLGHKIIEVAKQIYWAAKSQNLCRGKGNDAVAGASVYFSCRQENTPRTFYEIASASSSNKRDIGRCYKAMEKYLKTKGMSKMTKDDMIARICTQFVFENAQECVWIQDRACKVARLADENNLIASKSPLSVAAAAVFMVVLATNPGRPRITRDMSKASGVSEVTLRNVYREYYNSRHLIMPTCSIITRSAIEHMPSLQQTTS